MEPADARKGRDPSVFVFNPFAEGYIARGNAFTPVKHQAMLASDLANLPQFLCEPGDVVLLPERPSVGFLKGLEHAGFPPPEFVELKAGRIDPAGSLCHRKLVTLRPWAWGPDTVALFESLFARVAEGPRTAERYFNDDIARLYSKAWSASVLRKALKISGPRGTRPAADWLCAEQEIGVAVDSLEDALEAITAIRGRGHRRVVVKEALGLAGHNAIRLWEPEVLPAQRQWMARAVANGRQLVVEPWLERELDFSVQLEMDPARLRVCGYTGLVNDRKGQYVANWAEENCETCLPVKVGDLLGPGTDISRLLKGLYDVIFSILEAELQQAGFTGPVSIDAFVYRNAGGECRLKPIVEINPRYTMGRLTLELMKHVCPGNCGLFRLVSRARAREEGFANLQDYARALAGRLPLRLESGAMPKIGQGAICLNDPGQAQVCLATFEVSRRREELGEAQNSG